MVTSLCFQSDDARKDGDPHCDDVLLVFQSDDARKDGDPHSDDVILVFRVMMRKDGDPCSDVIILVFRAITREKTVIPVVSPLPPVRTTYNHIHSDDVSEADHVGFGAMLDKICTTRLHGDITDKNFAPKQSRKVD